jgi:hypothetical protein
MAAAACSLLEQYMYNKQAGKQGIGMNYEGTNTNVYRLYNKTYPDKKRLYRKPALIRRSA